ncbi:cell filamentation protein Fic [Prescottella equi]|nr:cell filamentation protein Fic [Prescottella equi]
MITVVDLAGVVYTAGKVFDGLAVGRRDTENFLRSGSLAGVSSRADLALLEDLRDVAQFVVDHHGQPIDALYVRAINAQITRRGALHPGQLRTEDQQIGVRTRYGRHSPPALTEDGLQQLIDSLNCDDVTENALDLFVELAKAQPFEDGNKRTALFVANSLLIGRGTLLVVPVDEHDPQLADTFNDLLAKAYIRDEHDAVKALLRDHGITVLPRGAQ